MKKMEYSDVAVVVLAAGKGKRMNSDLPKVLHKIDTKSMVEYVAQCAVEIAGNRVYVVVGHQAEKVKSVVSKQFNVTFVYQEKLLGTGDAVRKVMPRLPDTITNVVVLCGDVPLIKAETVYHLIETHKMENNTVTLLGVVMDDPSGYGRIIQNSEGKVTGIKEQADASGEEKNIKRVNAGIYCFKKEFLLYALPRITAENIQQEYYLTDVLEIAATEKNRIGMILSRDKREVLGVNTPGELKRMEGIINE